MNSTGDIIGRVSILVWIVLTPAIAACAQSSAGTSAQSRIGTELSGVAGGSGLVAGGDFVAADGMWGVKFGAFSRSRRFGLEGAFEQSTRLSGLRYAGGDFVFQFPIGGSAARTFPF